MPQIWQQNVYTSLQNLYVGISGVYLSNYNDTLNKAVLKIHNITTSNEQLVVKDEPFDVGFVVIVPS